MKQKEHYTNEKYTYIKIEEGMTDTQISSFMSTVQNPVTNV
jgi:hypothetical protein